MRRVNVERRNHPRWVIRGRLVARIARIYEAFLIDISPTGALVEHACFVRPGSRFFMTLLLIDQEVGLECKVVRSVVHRYSVGHPGQRELIYRTGLQFLEAPAHIPATNGQVG